MPKATSWRFGNVHVVAGRPCGVTGRLLYQPGGGLVDDEKTRVDDSGGPDDSDSLARAAAPRTMTVWPSIRRFLLDLMGRYHVN